MLLLDRPLSHPSLVGAIDRSKKVTTSTSVCPDLQGRGGRGLARRSLFTLPRSPTPCLIVSASIELLLVFAIAAGRRVPQPATEPASPIVHSIPQTSKLTHVIVCVSLPRPHAHECLLIVLPPRSDCALPRLTRQFPILLDKFSADVIESPHPPLDSDRTPSQPRLFTHSDLDPSNQSDWWSQSITERML